MDRKLLLIDGHSLIFRMYYAFVRRPMINSKGQDVSILYGFLKYLFEIVAREAPTHLAVCFDPPGKTFRHQMYPQYKGTRQATPELVIEALQPLTQLCGALRIPVLMVPGFEGDDVLGSMAVRSAAEGFTVYMVTPDKDFGQLISERIFQYKPGKAGADSELVGVKEICDKFGLQSPLQVIDILTLCGDTADNVPGVDGVGEVGASKLIGRYGSVENIYDHLEELTERQRGQMLAARDHIALSKTLVTIKTDIPLEVSADDMLLAAEHTREAFELFDSYEFSSLKKYLKAPSGVSLSSMQAPSVELEWRQCDASAFCAKARAAGEFAVIVESDGAAASASAAQFPRASRLVCAVRCEGTYYACEGAPADFAAVLSDASLAKAGYELKQAVNLLLRCGISLEGRLYDIELMHYLINPEKSHKVDILARSYAGVNLEQDDAPQAEQAPMSLFDAVALAEDEGGKSRIREAVCLIPVLDGVREELRSLQMEKLYLDMEEPLLRVLAAMERDGVKVDMGPLQSEVDSLRAEMASLEAKVRSESGVPQLNLSSPKQVGTMLFETLCIDPKLRARKGPGATYPTDEETLLGYAPTNPIIYDILDFREVKKLLGTYVEPFGGWISPVDGRIHTTFNQALTATGRLSSSRPNLQNIPIRTERGRFMRKAFSAPDDGKVIVSADYSQIELRLMAHFCGDENLCGAFREGVDVHSATAAKIFKVPVGEVTDDMRRSAKTANFGIMYGISAFGLAQRLRVPRVAAQKLIEDYFASFPSIREWIEKTQQEALRDGYVQTLFGRRRYLPDISSRNATVRALAQRNAVNAPIQGTAADIIKMAMTGVARSIREQGLKSRMVLQIHDELLFEAPVEELDALMEIIHAQMENVISLSVPLTVECNYGKNWLEAH